MTVSSLLLVQDSIYAALSNALVAVGEEMQVLDHAPTDQPEEYIRMDGFSVSDVANYKDRESGRHSFMVHFFGRPHNSLNISRGQTRPKEIMAVLHDAIMGTVIDGKCPKFQYLELDADNDGTTQHASLRYTVEISN